MAQLVHIVQCKTKYIVPTPLNKLLFTVVFGYKAVNTNPPLPCGVSEISPDVTPEVREKCRQMREQRAKEQRRHSL